MKEAPKRFQISCKPFESKTIKEASTKSAAPSNNKLKPLKRGVYVMEKSYKMNQL